MAVDVTVMRTARAYRRVEMMRAIPSEDPMGMARIVTMLQMIAEA